MRVRAQRWRTDEIDVADVCGVFGARMPASRVLRRVGVARARYVREPHAPHTARGEQPPSAEARKLSGAFRKMAAADEVLVTCSAGVNIAVIKYWGKRDEKLILPINSSLSATLSQDDLCTTTSILASPRLTEDRLWLNGKEAPIDGDRTQAVLREIRARAQAVRRNGKVAIPGDKLRSYKVHIVSHNNFPTAAGLASSASGFATLGAEKALQRIITRASSLLRSVLPRKGLPGGGAVRGRAQHSGAPGQWLRMQKSLWCAASSMRTAARSRCRPLR